MKKLFILAIILTALATVFGQNKTDKTAAEIKKLDSLWQVESYGSKDLKDYDRIVADDFFITVSNGKTFGKSEKRANVAADYIDPSTREADTVFKIDETSHQVRVFKDAAISNGYIIEKYTYKGNKINSRVYFTCTYLKRGGKWQAVAAQYTRINQT